MLQKLLLTWDLCYLKFRFQLVRLNFIYLNKILKKVLKIHAFCFLGIIAVLSIDVLTDMLPAISLACEKAERNIMIRPPRNPKKDILVTQKLFFYTYGHIGLIESAAGYFVYFVVMAEYGFMPKKLLGSYLFK